MSPSPSFEPSAELRLHRLTGAFLAGYRNANTPSSYLQQLHRWFAWCTAHQLDPLAVERTHVEPYLRWIEHQVGSINTVCHGLSVLGSFYRWLVQSGLVMAYQALRRGSETSHLHDRGASPCTRCAVAMNL
jgi:site-specific recombinase XerD